MTAQLDGALRMAAHRGYAVDRLQASRSVSPRLYKHWKLAALVIVAIAFAGYAHYVVGWRTIVQPWQFVRSFPEAILAIVSAAALLASSHVVRAVRIYRYFEVRRDFQLCVRLTLQQNFLVNVLPMRLGELSFPALLHSHFHLPMNRTIPALLWFRALDFHVLVSLAIAIMCVLGYSAAVFAAPLWAAALIFAFVLRRWLDCEVSRDKSTLRNLAGRVFGAVPPEPSAFIENWGWTVLNWLIKAAAVAWLVCIFGGLPFGASVVGAIGGEFSAVSPIQGLGNFGSYEGAVVISMLTSGVAVDAALKAAFNAHLVVLGVSLIGVVASILIPNVPRRRASPSGAVAGPL